MHLRSLQCNSSGQVSSSNLSCTCSFPAPANSSLITDHTAPSLSQCHVTANQTVTSQRTGNVREKGNNWDSKALWNGCSWPAQGDLKPSLLHEFSQQQSKPDPVQEEISALCALPRRMSNTGSAPHFCTHELLSLWQKWQQSVPSHIFKQMLPYWHFIVPGHQLSFMLCCLD